MSTRLSNKKCWIFISDRLLQRPDVKARITANEEANRVAKERERRMSIAQEEQALEKCTEMLVSPTTFFIRYSNLIDV